MSISRGIWRSPLRWSDFISAVYTPDKRYIIVRGRLWRASDPSLSDQRRQLAVNALMDARRAARGAHGNAKDLKMARDAVESAKQILGERGPVRWTDGAPDYNRRLAKNTPYAEWFLSLVPNAMS